MPQHAPGGDRRDPAPSSTTKPAELDRHLVAVLAADAVNYSQRMDVDEERAYHDLVACREIMLEKVRMYGGATVSTPGDFLLAAFESSSSALRAALSIQSAIAQRNTATESDGRFEFRIGIGLGDIIRVAGDIHGTAVNVAARLQQLASPGGVLVAGGVYDAVSRQSGVGFHYVGTRKLKNISQPVRVYAAFWLANGTEGAAASAHGGRGPHEAPPPPALDEGGLRRPSIEIAGFEALTPGDDTRLVAAGIVEEIVTALGRLQGSLIVRYAVTRPDAGRAAARGDEGRGDETRAEEGRVGDRNRYRLSGSVRLLQSELVVTARLVDEGSAVTRWADRYVYGLSDSLDIPQVIAREVVAALQIALTEGQQAALWNSRTTNFRAWENFLRGHDQEGRYRRECHLAARRFYEHALAHDPRYIAAIVALAFCHLDEIRLGWSHDDDHAFAEATRLSGQAAAIDADYPDLHALIAYMHLHRGNHDAALSSMRHALELEPRSPELAGYLGTLLDSIGRQEEAIEAYKAAMRLSSYCPAWIASNLALTFCVVGRLEEAEHTYQSLLSEHPDYVRAHIGLSAVHVRQGRLGDARKAARAVLSLDPNFKTEDWGRHQPFSDKATIDAFIADLKAAGLP